MRYKTDDERRQIGVLTRARLMGHVVEGKLVTTREIADRFGVTIECARKRARRGPFPLTWEGLEGRKKRG